MSEVVAVAFYLKTAGLQDCGKLMSEVAIGEKDSTQAARSYRTACSMSASLKP